MAHNSESAVKAALIANGLIAAMKLVGALFSGSAAMMAEFKHSVGDWGNSFFLLVGVRQAERPRDERYQFGHGKRVFFWSFIASLGMLFIGGALSIYGGALKILHPEPLQYVGLNLIIIVLSILFEIYSFSMAVRAIVHEAGIEARGLGVISDAFSVLARATPATRFIFLEDTAALAGLVMAGTAIILAEATGNLLFDGVASILIGILLFFIGFGTARENAAAILGESADLALIREIGDFVMTMPGVVDIHNVRSMSIGPNKYLLEMLIEANEKLPLGDCDDISLTVKKKVKEKFREIGSAHIAVISDDRKRQWRAD
ncbi:MAG: cation diffusion facilitator family transporter [Eubacteriales bacterium]